MLHVITNHNRNAYAAQLNDSFRVRHKVFVDGLGWEDLRQPDGREIDQFDTDDAIHLVFLNEEDRVVGGSRLLPTTQPHLLSEVFPHLASARPLPIGTDVFEWTRFYVSGSEGKSPRDNKISRMIMCGLLEYCLDHGIDTLSAVAEPIWIPRFFRLGWNPEPLGIPTQHKGQRIMGLKLTVSEQALEKTRKGIKTKTSILQR